MFMTKTLAGVLALATLLPAGVFAAEVTRARYLMGTVCEVTAGSEAQVEAAFAEADRIESMISTWREGSELSRFNRGEIAAPSPELAELIDTVMRWSRETGGAFDPRVRGLIDVWRTREQGAVPTEAQIAAARKRQELEEGAFGKGYAIDRMLALIDGEAVINFGGQIGVRGERRVTIADPAHRDRPVLAFTMTHGSLSTSSGSEKAFNVGGRRFSHLFDPRTGQALPPRGSVSVVHDSALIADILSTALYVMGVDEGMHWARDHGIAAIFIDERNDVFLSARMPGFEVLDRRFRVARSGA
jgi:thiamine biosynthesis lipoprotein